MPIGAVSLTRGHPAFTLGLTFLALAFGPLHSRAEGPDLPAATASRANASTPAADPADFSHYADIIASWPPEIAAAVMTLAGRPHETWSWIYATTTEDGMEEYLWDPARPARERSVLLSKDGAPASAGQQAAHLEERAEREAGREKSPPAQRIARARALLATLEFQLLDENDLASTWQVVSRTTEFDALPLSDRIRNRVLAALRGRLVVSKTPPGFIEFALKNPHPIDAAVSISFSEVDLLLRKARQPGTDVFLPVEISGKVRGRYLFLGKIDRTWSTTFRAHQAVKQDAESDASSRP